MIKSYISAIKAVLMEDNIEISEDKFLISSLIRSCRIHNDQIVVKLPIKRDLVGLLLKIIKDIFLDNGQPFLASLYQALFATTYFGLFRIGEVTCSPHVL